VSCPQKCTEADLQRCKVEEHLKTCANSIVECEFKHVGCNTYFKRKDIPRHLKDHVIDHQKLLNTRLMLMSTYFMSKDTILDKILHPSPPPKDDDEQEEEEEEKGDMNS